MSSRKWCNFSLPLNTLPIIYTFRKTHNFSLVWKVSQSSIFFSECFTIFCLIQKVSLTQLLQYISDKVPHFFRTCHYLLSFRKCPHARLIQKVSLPLNTNIPVRGLC